MAVFNKRLDFFPSQHLYSLTFCLLIRTPETLHYPPPAPSNQKPNRQRRRGITEGTIAKSALAGAGRLPARALLLINVYCDFGLNLLPVAEMKTQEFLIGLSGGLTAGILLMLALAHRYTLETGQTTPAMRMNTMTGQTWIILPSH